MNLAGLRSAAGARARAAGRGGGDSGAGRGRSPRRSRRCARRRPAAGGGALRGAPARAAHRRSTLRRRSSAVARRRSSHRGRRREPDRHDASRRSRSVTMPSTAASGSSPPPPPLRASPAGTDTEIAHPPRRLLDRGRGRMVASGQRPRSAPSPGKIAIRPRCSPTAGAAWRPVLEEEARNPARRATARTPPSARETAARPRRRWRRAPATGWRSGRKSEALAGFHDFQHLAVVALEPHAPLADDPQRVAGALSPGENRLPRRRRRISSARSTPVERRRRKGIERAWRERRAA